MSRNSARMTVEQYKDWFKWFNKGFKKRHKMTIEQYRNKDF